MKDNIKVTKLRGDPDGKQYLVTHDTHDELKLGPQEIRKHYKAICDAIENLTMQRETHIKQLELAPKQIQSAIDSTNAQIKTLEERKAAFDPHIAELPEEPEKQEGEPNAKVE